MPQSEQFISKFFLHILYISIIIISVGIIFFLSKSIAGNRIDNRDSITEGKKRFYGRGARVGTSFTISKIDSTKMQQVTFGMGNSRALLIKIQTYKKNSGVIMLVSQVGSSRLLKAVWKCDDIRAPIIFWTDHFWIPDKECNAFGCPKIRFQAIRGKLSVTILDKR